MTAIGPKQVLSVHDVHSRNSDLDKQTAEHSHSGPRLLNVQPTTDTRNSTVVLQVLRGGKEADVKRHAVVPSETLDEPVTAHRPVAAWGCGHRRAFGKERLVLSG